MNTRHAAAIIFYDKNGKVLLQERGLHSKLGEEWGFFGGKIEEGETSKQAIEREIKEELNYDLKELEFFGKFEYPLFKDWLITVEMFIAPLPDQKELNLTEGKSYRLFDIDKTENLVMVPGDHIILKAVNNYLDKNIGLKMKLGIYKHFKGNTYEVIGVATHSETMEVCVVYKALAENSKRGKGAIWIRPLKMFLENVIVDGKEVPRFKFIGTVK